MNDKAQKAGALPGKVFAGVLLPMIALLPAHAGTALTTLHSFHVTNGTYPFAGLTQGADGGFYGTTTMTGWSPGGTVFKISADGAFTNLHTFSGAPGGTNGFNPYGALSPGPDGNFYGSTAGSGGSGATLFRITPDGVLTTLYRFDCTNGCEPVWGLVLASDGNFYGTTYRGGLGYQGGGETGYGTIFRFSTNGAFTNVYFFTGGEDGANPGGGLVQGPDGLLYGVTGNGGANSNGTIFKITTDGQLTNLYSFHGMDGRFPPGALLFGKDGYLYGTTQFGGPNTNYNGVDSGTVFRISTNGALTTLVIFYGTNGAQPIGSLIQASDGNFYGTTAGGGSTNVQGGGTIFKVTPAGVFTTVHVFTGYDGVECSCTLLQASDGNLYGTTTTGGDYGNYSFGTVFRLSLPLAPAFQIVSNSSAGISLTWSSVAGQSYQLQYMTDASQTNWSNLGNPLVATNATITAIDPISSDPQRFYRVLVLP